MHARFYITALNEPINNTQLTRVYTWQKTTIFVFFFLSLEQDYFHRLNNYTQKTFLYFLTWYPFFFEIDEPLYIYISKRVYVLVPILEPISFAR